MDHGLRGFTDFTDKMDHGLRGFTDFTDKIAGTEIRDIRVIFLIRDADNGMNLKELGLSG
jgi:hypothetical protein